MGAVRARSCWQVDRSHAYLEEELIVQSGNDIGGDGDAALCAQLVPATRVRGLTGPPWTMLLLLLNMSDIVT